MVFPVTVVLSVLSFGKNYIKNRKMVYILGLSFTFVVAFVDGLNSAGIHLGPITDIMSKLPLFDLGIGWILPAIVGSLIGFLPFLNRKEKVIE